MSLMKLNILEDSMDVVRGHQMIMQYGNGNFYAAFERCVRELNALLPNQEISEEGFIDWIKDTGTYVWNKIKELWNMFISFIKRIFGKNTLENTGSIHSVTNYGQFPEGYVPSEFENANATIGTGFFMQSVRSMQTYLERVDAIARLIDKELISMMVKTLNDYDFEVDNEELPITRFRFFCDNHAAELRDLCGININTGRIMKLFYKDDAVFYKNYVDKLYYPLQPASLYAKVNPYTEGGWNSGIVFKNIIGRNGLLSTVKQRLSTASIAYNDKIVNRYDALKKSVAPKLVHATQASKDRYALWDDHIATINEIVLKIFARFSKEIAYTEELLRINRDAIEKDIANKFEKK